MALKFSDNILGRRTKSVIIELLWWVGAEVKFRHFNYSKKSAID
jgi:hypothetical protein